LKIINPQSSPKKIAGIKDWKTAKSAYPAAKAANTPVKKTVAPIPTYLLLSVGVRFSKAKFAPLQNQKKWVIRFMKGDLEIARGYNAKTLPNEW
jgi:hypothetical protein